MKTVEIIGYHRANLGKSESKRMRAEGNVPCVLYGGKDQVHFYSPAILFKDLIYTDQPRFVKLNIEGDEYDAIMQDSQYHPVSEMILHVDFLLLNPSKKIKMNIPVQAIGTSPGVQQGGKLITKLRMVSVRAFPKDMPEAIEVDITNLALGKSLRVSDLQAGKYEILNDPQISVISVDVPRGLKGKADEPSK